MALADLGMELSNSALGGLGVEGGSLEEAEQGETMDTLMHGSGTRRVCARV